LTRELDDSLRRTALEYCIQNLSMRALIFAFILAFTFSAQAQLLTRKVYGLPLVDVVSQTVPRRAVQEAFAFFDRYEDKQRLFHRFALGPLCNDPKLTGFACSNQCGLCYGAPAIETTLQNKQYMVIFDLNRPSNEKRLHIIDLATGQT
jgi:hypothetical protein